MCFYRYILVTEENMVSQTSNYCLHIASGLAYRKKKKKKSIFKNKALILCGRRRLVWVCS